MSATAVLISDLAMRHSSIPLIRELYYQRQQLVRAHGSLVRQIKAVERRLAGQGVDDSHHKLAGEAANGQCVTDFRPMCAVAVLATMPLRAALEPIEAERKQLEKRLRREAEKLPVFSWVKAVNGFGALGLAQIVGEAGNLSNYPNPAKLWKRMGLAVFDGRAQRRVSGDAAIEQGYCPRRRSVMFVIGDSLLKKQSAYRELYLARKLYEQQKVPDGTKMLWHRRAQRYAEKRLLLDLWKAWRVCHISCESPARHAHASRPESHANHNDYAGAPFHCRTDALSAREDASASSFEEGEAK